MVRMRACPPRNNGWRWRSPWPARGRRAARAPGAVAPRGPRGQGQGTRERPQNVKASRRRFSAGGTAVASPPCHGTNARVPSPKQWLALALALAGAGTSGSARADERSLFSHDGDGAVWLSGQVNVITQAHPRFPAAYTGDQSLQPGPEVATSFVGTLFTGFALTSVTEAFVDVESAGGSGISKTFGLGGFTNLDVVRNPTLSAEPYLRRLELRQIFPLDGQTAEAER